VGAGAHAGPSRLSAAQRVDDFNRGKIPLVVGGDDAAVGFALAAMLRVDAAPLSGVPTRNAPSMLAKRANQSLHEIGRSSPFGVAVVVNHFSVFHGSPSQEQGFSKPFKTLSKVCLIMKLDAVLEHGVRVLAALSDCKSERFHDGDLISSDEICLHLKHLGEHEPAHTRSHGAQSR
jgi:hypothetical protein